MNPLIKNSPDLSTRSANTSPNKHLKEGLINLCNEIDSYCLTLIGKEDLLNKLQLKIPKQNMKEIFTFFTTLPPSQFDTNYNNNIKHVTDWLRECLSGLDMAVETQSADIKVNKGYIHNYISYNNFSPTKHKATKYVEPPKPEIEYENIILPTKTDVSFNEDEDLNLITEPGNIKKVRPPVNDIEWLSPRKANYNTQAKPEPVNIVTLSDEVTSFADLEDDHLDRIRNLLINILNKFPPPEERFSPTADAINKEPKTSLKDKYTTLLDNINQKKDPTTNINTKAMYEMIDAFLRATMECIALIEVGDEGGYTIKDWARDVTYMLRLVIGGRSVESIKDLVGTPSYGIMMDFRGKISMSGQLAGWLPGALSWDKEIPIEVKKAAARLLQHANCGEISAEIRRKISQDMRLDPLKYVQTVTIKNGDHAFLLFLYDENTKKIGKLPLSSEITAKALYEQYGENIYVIDNWTGNLKKIKFINDIEGFKEFGYIGNVKRYAEIIQGNPDIFGKINKNELTFIPSYVGHDM